MVLFSLIAASILAAIAYMLSYGRARRLVIAATHQKLHHSEWNALPVHYGWYAVGRTLGIALILAVLWWILRQPIIETLLPYRLPVPQTEDMSFFLLSVRSIVSDTAFGTPAAEALRWAEEYRLLLSKGDQLVALVIAALALWGIASSHRRVRPDIEARKSVESWVLWVMRLAAGISIAITALIFFSVVFEAILFFGRIPIGDFLFGLDWSPQTALRADQAGASGLFGMLPLLLGTLLITFIALCVAVPVGVMSAIYLSEYAGSRARAIGKPMLEILAGIPTVVYGFFAITVMAPFIRDMASIAELSVSSESALGAGLVMGIMIIPLVSSLSDDALKAVPVSLRDASYGLGATASETICRVLIPAALPGIIGGILLATSRAIGETMIVVMAAGLAANLTINPLESVTTITVQIVALLVGDQEFGSTKTLAAFALGLSLFLFTLVLNIIALMIVRKYRQAYE